MSDGKFIASDAGFEHLLTVGIKSEIERRTAAIVAAAGGEDVGFYGHVDVRGKRMVGRVVAGSPHARNAEAKDGRLSRAVDAGRGTSR